MRTLRSQILCPCMRACGPILSGALNHHLRSGLFRKKMEPGEFFFRSHNVSVPCDIQSSPPPLCALHHVQCEVCSVCPAHGDSLPLSGPQCPPVSVPLRPHSQAALTATARTRHSGPFSPVPTTRQVTPYNICDAGLCDNTCVMQTMTVVTSVT